MDKIENILRYYTKQIPELRMFNYWERLQKLKMNSEIRRKERYKIIYVWKALEELVPIPGIQHAQLNEKKGRMCTVPFSRNNKRKATYQVSWA